MGFAPGPGGGSSSIGGSTDVSLNNVQNNQVLGYNSSSSKWQNNAPSSSDDLAPIMIRRVTTTQTVTSTTNPTTIASLTASLDANAEYAITGRLVFSDDGASGSSAGDAKIVFSEPSGAIIEGQVTGLASNTTSGVGAVRVADIGGYEYDGSPSSVRYAVVGTTGSNSRHIATVDLTVRTGSAGGDLLTRFAQSVADPATLRLHIGSVLYITRLA